MSYLTIFALLFTGFVLGAFSLLAYILYRMMKNDDWDDSNITNALRLLSHTTLHPQDFGAMRYVSSSVETYLLKEHNIKLTRPFWYVTKDELSEVVKTRPPNDVSI